MREKLRWVSIAKRSKTKFKYDAVTRQYVREEDARPQVITPEDEWRRLQRRGAFSAPALWCVDEREF